MSIITISNPSGPLLRQLLTFEEAAANLDQIRSFFFESDHDWTLTELAYLRQLMGPLYTLTNVIEEQLENETVWAEASEQYNARQAKQAHPANGLRKTGDRS
ncbi:hypothetical protein [Microbacterium sp. NPDC076895]|uniref:hypothetical protein n=1 Tax=Microbacterium sp. NPDC076895 TaxID=3154957 RepID=UPI003428BD21